jgi:hypothetical protein
VVTYSKDEIRQAEGPVISFEISSFLGGFGSGDYGSAFIAVSGPFVQILGFVVKLDGEVLIQSLDDHRGGGQFVGDSVAYAGAQMALVQPEITPPPVVSGDLLFSG